MAQTKITHDNIAASFSLPNANLNNDVFNNDRSWTGSQRSTMVTDNDGNFDLNGGQNFKCTPSGNITLTFSNHVSGQSGFVILVLVWVSMFYFINVCNWLVTTYTHKNVQQKNKNIQIH